MNSLLRPLAECQVCVRLAAAGLCTRAAEEARGTMQAANGKREVSKLVCCWRPQKVVRRGVTKLFDAV